MDQVAKNSILGILLTDAKQVISQAQQQKLEKDQ